jgi:hypothetical protein
VGELEFLLLLLLGAAALVRGAGAQVVEAPAQRLPRACVGAYLRAKARARL